MTGAAGRVDVAGPRPAIRALPAGEFGIRCWFVDLGGDWPVDEVRSLSADEHARGRRFVFPADRRRFVASHHALRELLGAELGVPAASVSFEIGTTGKPRLAGNADPAAERIEFNMSHSEDAALIGIARGREMGVDIERVRTIGDVDALATRHFSVGERRVLRRPGDSSIDRTFLTGWTRKEACLKAIGAGLSLDTRSFEVGCVAESVRTAISAAEGIYTVDVATIDLGTDWVGAVARVVSLKAPVSARA